jgi:hypothetical protein
MQRPTIRGTSHELANELANEEADNDSVDSLIWACGRIKWYCERRLCGFTRVKGDHLQETMAWIQEDRARLQSALCRVEMRAGLGFFIGPCNGINNAIYKFINDAVPETTYCSGNCTHT